jgi:phage gp29-like protein
VAGLQPIRAGSVPKIGPDFAQFVASRQQTEWIYWAGQEEAHPSRILLEHSRPGALLGELYDDMLTADATLAGLWEKRWKAVVGLPWSIAPADNSRKARKIARQAEMALDAIPGLDLNLRHQLEGIVKGVSFDEVRWEQKTSGPLSGLWVPVAIEDRPMHRFAFKVGGALHVRKRDGSLTPTQAGRFLVLRHGTKDQPWGAPLLDRAWWVYYLTVHVAKYWGVATEKWAQPTALVRYKRAGGSDADANTANRELVAAALSAAADFQTEYAIALPEDLDIELKEAQKSGSVSYDLFIGWLDRLKALLILGEVDTSGLGKATGSYAKSRVSNDVRLETIRMDARELGDSLTDQLLSVFARVNFGADAPVPYWLFDVEEAEDRELRQKGANNILNRGLPISREYFYRVNQCAVPEDGAEVVRDPQIVGTVTVPREYYPETDDEVEDPGDEPERIAPRARKGPPPTRPEWDEQEVVH